CRARPLPQSFPTRRSSDLVDSLDLAQAIDRIAHEDGLHPRILLEVNVAGEGSKFGFKAATLRAELKSLLMLPRLSIEGLMCIPRSEEHTSELQSRFDVVCR